MIKFITKFLPLSILICSSFVLPQEYKFEAVTTRDGLSQDLVNSIFQDSRHFLWISTSNGLNRYDGNKFRIYKPIQQDPKTISGINVWEIAEDKEGNLWIATYGGGLNKYIRKTDTFVRIMFDPNNPDSPRSDKIEHILLDKDEHLWIASDLGLSRLDLKTGKFRHFKSDPKNSNSLCYPELTALVQDSEGKIWIGTLMGLSVYDPLTDKFKSYLNKSNDPNSLSHNYIHVIYEDKRKNIWVGTHNGLNLLNKKKDNFTRFLPDPQNPNSLNNEIISDILEDRLGHLWIASSSKGLNVYDRDKNIFKHYTHNPFDPNSINSNSIHCLYQDQAGVLWIGSYGGGLIKLDFNKSQFQHIRNEPVSNNTLSSNHIASFAVDKDNSIWIGTLGGGLDHFTRKGNLNLFNNYTQNPHVPFGLINDQVYSIAVQDADNLWLGTEKGVQKYCKSANKFTAIDPFSRPGFANTPIYSVMVDHSGSLWVGSTKSGICYFDKAKKSFINLFHHADDPKSLASDAVRYLYEDRKRNIWVCTVNGLDYFHRGKNEFIHFKFDPDNPNSLSDLMILLIFEDSEGNLWVGTPSGLNKMVGNIDNPESIRFIRYSTQDGLPGNTIQGILEDRNKNLWISTDNGLSKFNRFTKTFTNFTTDDGLQGNGFYVTACARIPNTGEMLLGGDNGFNIFVPENIREDTYPPPVAITDFQIDNRRVPVNSKFDGRIVLEKVIGETKDLTLPYNQNNLSLEFSSLSFSNPSSNIHAYKMEGLDSAWVNIGNRRFASFTNLSPGEYTFKVKAANHSGLWNENFASIRINIRPPFWQTFLFRAFTLVILVGMVFFAYKYKTRNMHKRSQDLQREVDKRTKELQSEVKERIKIEEKLVASKDIAEAANRSKSEFLANMSHELRTPLNAILGYAQILQKQDNITRIQKEHLLTIIKSGEHLLTLINEILDLRRMEVRREEVNNTVFNLRNLIHEVVNTIRIKAIEKNLSFYYEKEPSVSERLIGDANKIKQILLNLLGNAVKYTITGSISLDVEDMVHEPENNECNTKSKIIFKISDTGIGIPKEKFEDIFQPFQSESKPLLGIDSTGLGLAITKRLVELLGGRLTLESKVDEGTTFVFELDLEVAENTEQKTIESEKKIIGFEGNNRKILVVDDNQTNLNMLTAILKPLGFEISISENGNQALNEIKTSPPDLVLLDLLMPEMNGQRFLEEIKTFEAKESIKIVGISAAVADKESIARFSADCDAFVPKPINAAQLLDEIGKVLDLIWIRKEEKFLPEQEDSPELPAENFPPAAILSKIIEKVNIGDYKGLTDLLDIIENEESDFRIFCLKVRTFAKNYDDDAVIRYCRR
jgi:signal transduction histidine kinase/ligand-binding sensor domain-containing protein/CheY-like chemotaxis protein